MPVGLLLLAVEEALGGLRLHHHHANAVGDHVVQLARGSRTFLGYGESGLRLSYGRTRPQLHQALEKMNSVAFIVTMLPLGVTLAAVATVALKTRVLPLWLGLLAAITAPASLVNGIFLDAEFGPRSCSSCSG